MSETKGLNPIIVSLCRFAGISSVLLAIIFIINNFITYIGGAPGVNATLGAVGLFGFTPPKGDVSGGMMTMGWIQVLMNIGGLILVKQHYGPHIKMDPNLDLFIL